MTDRGGRADAGDINNEQAHYYHDDQLREIVTDTGVPPPDPPTSLSSIFHAELPPMPRLGAPPGHMVPPAHVPILPPPIRPLKHVLPVKDHTHILPGHRCPEYGYLPCASRLKFWVELQPRAVAAEEEAKVRCGAVWRGVVRHESTRLARLRQSTSPSRARASALPRSTQTESARPAVRCACPAVRVPLPPHRECVTGRV